MQPGITVHLTGPRVPETTKALAIRLLELKRPVERINEEWAVRFGGAGGADAVCGLLSRNGVVVLATYAGAAPEGASLVVEIDEHDTPDFAADKILDSLAEAGVVDLESEGYSPEEEEQVRQRLADLGYVE